GVTYTPNADYNGADSFTFKANDGAADSGEATVSITVKAVNDNPVANADTTATDEDAAVVVDVRANDSDVDGDQLVVSSAGGASKGTVSVTQDNKVRYTPNLNENGSDSFTYTVSDGHGGTATGMVGVTI